MSDDSDRPVHAGPSRAELDEIQAKGLADLLAAILPAHRFYDRKFREAGLSVSRLSFPRDLTALPFTTKAELLEAQGEQPPHGGLISFPFSDYVRMHQTSGTSGRPLRWYDTTASWSALLDCWREMFALAGITAEDRLFFPFSFGPFLGFWSAFEAGLRHGCLCLPGGGMSSVARLRFLIDNEATVVFCTPTYALRLVEAARQEQMELRASSVRAVVVAGEPGGSIAGTRRRIEEGWGARVLDHNGMTETGPLGIECVDGPGGLSLLETACLPEIVDPVTGEPRAPGDEGELVITTFRRTASPLIRYRTGDLVRLDPRADVGGRASARLDGGIRGRCDDMLVIRGNNFHPSTLQTILHRFDEVAEYVVEIEQNESQTSVALIVEAKPDCDADKLTARLEETIQAELLFRIGVSAAEPGSLPRAEMKAMRIRRKT